MLLDRKITQYKYYRATRLVQTYCYNTGNTSMKRLKAPRLANSTMTTEYP